jgi:hypothetical protein
VKPASWTRGRWRRRARHLRPGRSSRSRKAPRSRPARAQPTWARTLWWSCPRPSSTPQDGRNDDRHKRAGQAWTNPAWVVISEDCLTGSCCCSRQWVQIGTRAGITRARPNARNPGPTCETAASVPPRRPPQWRWAQTFVAWTTKGYTQRPALVSNITVIDEAPSQVNAAGWSGVGGMDDCRASGARDDR